MYLLILHLQSSDPTWLPGEEKKKEKEVPNPALMSPAAKILKLGAENTVSNITNYLLHYLGRELEDISSHFNYICSNVKLHIITNYIHFCYYFMFS